MLRSQYAPPLHFNFVKPAQRIAFKIAQHKEQQAELWTEMVGGK